MARIGFISLGCEKNTYDTECAIGALLSLGHEITGDPAEADCVVINTCGFIEPAREEARDNIRDMLLLKKERPSLKVLITGCYAQKYMRELEELFPQADGILGIELQHGIGEAIDRLLSGSRLREVRQPSAVWREPEPGRCALTPFW
ncbi:MAG: 30S ribosomal protein S12 methylthiotransferase RimO, partial [Abditibacteriota bacterium]|nr:30S ribosomal protein S12 methylthiotransferase RimO [Abditibacteriota bacterium]